jgi:hypothetical protein
MFLYRDPNSNAIFTETLKLHKCKCNNRCQKRTKH